MKHYSGAVFVALVWALPSVCAIFVQQQKLVKGKNHWRSHRGRHVPVTTTLHSLPSNCNHSFPSKLGRCALVGSSAILKDANRGREIDSHETVIRVNSMPIAEYASDFGSKTDVLFLNKKLSASGRAQFLGGKQVDCTKGGSNCNFTSVILKEEKWADVWVEAPFPIGVEDKTARLAAADMATMDGILPSSGFIAFLTFGPICDALTLYGFGGGKATADGHHVGEQHDFDIENALMDRIVNGDMEHSDWQEGFSSPEDDFHAFFAREMVLKLGRLNIVRN